LHNNLPKHIRKHTIYNVVTLVLNFIKYTVDVNKSLKSSDIWPHFKTFLPT